MRRLLTLTALLFFTYRIGYIFLSFFLRSRKICDCLFGFPRSLHGKEAKDLFLDEIHSLQHLLPDPWDAGASKEGTVQIHVPKLAPSDAGVDDSVKEVVAASSVSRLGRHTVVLKKAVENHAEHSASDDFEVRFCAFPELVCLFVCGFHC